MKLKYLFLALVTVAAICFPSWAHAADSNEEQIRKIENEWLNAIVKRDGAYLRKLEASGFTMTGPDGKVLSKDEDIKSTTAGETSFEDIKLDNVKVRFYGNTAVAVGTGMVKARSGEQDLSGKYSWTDVFVKMNGEWKAVAAHVTAVAPERK